MKILTVIAGLSVAFMYPSIGTAKTLRTIINSDLRSTMPGSGPDTNSGAIRQNIYEGLVAAASDGSVRPMLADSYLVKDDGKTYEFKLRKGVKFHNGAPLTSAEVVWTWNQFLFSDTAWACRSGFSSDFLKVTSVEAIDNETVAFHLAQPSGAFLAAMTRSDCDGTGIAHPDSANSKGEWVNAIGTGPFKLAEWSKGRYVRLQKYDDYSSRVEQSDGLTGAKRPLLDEVQFDVIADPDTVVAAMKTGALDLWFSVDPMYVDELKHAKGVKIITSDSASVYSLPFHSDQPVVNNPKVREAIAYAIDVEALTKALTSGISKPSRSLVPITSQFYGDHEATAQIFDPERAKHLLAESGYKGEEIAIQTNKGSKMMADTAIYAQAMMAQVGINARVEVLEFPTQFERYYSGNYQMMVWNVAPYLDPTFIFERFIGNPETQKDKVWTSDGARKLLGELFKVQTDDEKKKIIDEMHDLFVREVPMIVWAARSGISAYSDKISGYEHWSGEKPRFWDVDISN